MKYPTDHEVSFDKRIPAQEVDKNFYRRWSPRSYKKVTLPQEIVRSIVDAARWSPSCMNEQPWLIITSGNEEQFNRFLALLVEKNQAWARNTSVIGFILAKKTFAFDDSPNQWSIFDCGAAWMALTLQANMFGLYTHGMAGIKADQVGKALDVPENLYQVVCGFTIGVIDTPEKLPAEVAAREFPSARKDLSEIWHIGSFKEV